MHIPASNPSTVETISGTCMEGVFPLVPLKKCRYIPCKKTFQNLRNLEKTSTAPSIDKSRGEKTSFSNTNSKYIYVGATAACGACGVYESMKALSDPKHIHTWNVISKFSRACEHIVTTYMESAEAHGLHHSKKILKYKTFLLSDGL